MTIRVTILGGGPSAVYAYYGCLDVGYKHTEIEVLTDRFNRPPGAFWLRQSPIDWPHIQVHLSLLGTPNDYSRKQWGDVRETSAHRYFKNFSSNTETAYSPYTLLPTLWSMLPVHTINDKITPEGVKLYKASREFVIQTFPMQKSPHQIMFPVYVNTVESNSFQCTYNGTLQQAWLRQTIIPGKVFVEYPYDPRNTDGAGIFDLETERWGRGGHLAWAPDLLPDTVPLSWEERIQDNLFLVGRFATQNRKALSHEGRIEVVRFLKEKMDGTRRSLAAASRVQSAGL